MDKTQIEKIAFTIAFAGILFSVHPLLIEIKLGPNIFGWTLQASYMYAFVASLLAAALYFYGLAYTLNRFTKISLRVGDQLLVLAVLAPPLFLITWSVTGIVHLLAESGDMVVGGIVPLVSTAISGTIVSLTIWRAQLIIADARSNYEKSILQDSIDEHSLEKYTRQKYPGIGISHGWQSRTVEDLRRGELADIFETIADIDDAVTQARTAVDAYASERPEVFRTGTDYITKSLGFVSPQFRQVHGFNTATRLAFKQYANLVSKS